MERRSFALQLFPLEGYPLGFQETALTIELLVRRRFTGNAQHAKKICFFFRGQLFFQITQTWTVEALSIR